MHGNHSRMEQPVAAWPHKLQHEHWVGQTQLRQEYHLDIILIIRSESQRWKSLGDTYVDMDISTPPTNFTYGVQILSVYKSTLPMLGNTSIQLKILFVIWQNWHMMHRYPTHPTLWWCSILEHCSKNNDKLLWCQFVTYRTRESIFNRGQQIH